MNAVAVAQPAAVRARRRRRSTPVASTRPPGSRITSKVYDEENPITLEMAKKWSYQNEANRPFRMGLAKRYALEILRGKWQTNGETIIFDWNGHLHQGQHRLGGLLQAEIMRAKDPEHWARYGWTGPEGKNPLVLTSVVVTGVSPESADTIDTGQKRTGGDVLFRQHRFDKTQFPKVADRKKLTNDLAAAARLVWLRSQQMVVSDAPKFPHTEMLDFVNEHKYIKTWVEDLYDRDGGVERNISSRISRSTLAAFLYLYENSFEDEGEGELKASQFADDFARGSDLTKDDPVFVLREALIKVRNGQGAASGASRDAINAMIVKAMLAHKEGRKITAVDLRVKKGEDPRLGGLDKAYEEVAEQVAADQEETAEET
jgi:hypothetical protein